jgi:hypothetical protein
MRRRAVEDLVLGQPTFTTSSRAQRQLWDTVPYSHFRPQAAFRGGQQSGFHCR